jgi:Pyruvate phosphate dikinase, AMP/ATP-binding domain
MTVGGKALNLGKLISEGLPVPPGFLVLTTAYECFVTANHLQTKIDRLIQTVSQVHPVTAETAAHEISELFKQGTLPAEIETAVFSAYQQLATPAVAVRSSATAEDLPGASFAGLYETFLGLGSATEVFSALKRCWAALWSARALIYRVRQHIPHHTVRMAVIVQQMVQQKVTVRQEDLLVPGDDAWEQHEKPEVHAYDLWTRTNIGENFLAPITPLSATLWPTFFVLGRFSSQEDRASGTPPLPVLGERFFGRMYVNEGAVIHTALEMGVPTSFLDSTWGSSGRGMRSSNDTIHILRLMSRVPSMVGGVRKAAKEQATRQPGVPKPSKQKQPRRSPKQLFAQIDTWVDAFQRVDLSQLDDHALWDFVPLWIKRAKALRSIFVAAGLAGITFYFLERKVNKWTGQTGQATVLVQALSGVYTAEVGRMLWHMTQTLSEAGLAEVVQEQPAEKMLEQLRGRTEAQPFLAEFETFIQRHGYRCPNDAELHNPRWAEQPAQVIELVKSYLRMDQSANPLVIEQRRKFEREETTRRLTSQINPLRRPLFNWLLKQAQDKTRLRDNNRSYVCGEVPVPNASFARRIRTTLGCSGLAC